MGIEKMLYEGLEKGIKAGTNMLESNKAINPIRATGKFILGEYDTGIRGTLKAMGGEGHNMNFTNAVKAAYTENGLGEKLNYKAIAGTYVGAAAAGRVLSGGGLYRDSNGDPNLPVVPFV